VTYAGPDPRRPRTTHTTRIVLIVLAVLLLGCGAVVVVPIVFNSIRGAAAGLPKDTVDAFIKHLEADETSAAYASLCARTRGQFTEADFARTVHNRPRIVDYSIARTDIANVNGSVSASVSTQLRYADSSLEPHPFPLVKEDNHWRICGQPY
jgi:hypothetical protein